MGHPRKHRAKWSRPLKPFDKARIESEAAVLKQFGLKRKHELWRADSIVRDFRRRARELLAVPNQKIRDEMLVRLNKLGIKVNTLDDVLGLKTEDVMARRLQTILVRRGIAKTLKQARQLIVHKHVLVDGRVVHWPGVIVASEDDERIDISQKIKSKMQQAVSQ